MVLDDQNTKLQKVSRATFSSLNLACISIIVVLLKQNMLSNNNEKIKNVVNLTLNYHTIQYSRSSNCFTHSIELTKNDSTIDIVTTTLCTQLSYITTLSDLIPLCCHIKSYKHSVLIFQHEPSLENLAHICLQYVIKQIDFHGYIFFNLEKKVKVQLRKNTSSNK